MTYNLFFLTYITQEECRDGWYCLSVDLPYGFDQSTLHLDLVIQPKKLPPLWVANLNFLII